MDIRPDGTLLAAAVNGAVLEFATGDDDAASLAWLTLSQDRGTVAPGGSTSISIRVDESRIPEGVEQVDLVLRGNGGAQGPVRVPIRLREGQQADTTLAVTATPAAVKVGGSTKVKVTVSSTSGITPTGKVSVSAAGVKAVGASLTDGTAVLSVGPFTKAGRIALTARYGGDAWNRASSRTVTLTVAGKPRLGLTSGTVPLVGGAAVVNLRCTGTSGRCSGPLVVTRGGTKVARGTASLTAGRTSAVRVPLTAKGLAVLRKGRPVSAVLTMPDGNGQEQRVRVVLRTILRR